MNKNYLYVFRNYLWIDFLNYYCLIREFSFCNKLHVVEIYQSILLYLLRYKESNKISLISLIPQLAPKLLSFEHLRRQTTKLIYICRDTDAADLYLIRINLSCNWSLSEKHFLCHHFDSVYWQIILTQIYNCNGRTAHNSNTYRATLTRAHVLAPTHTHTLIQSIVLSCPFL